MEHRTSPLRELSDTESLNRIATQSLGRVVTRVAEVVDIFPVNFVVDSGEIVVRTAEGTKLTEMLIGHEVLFEVDHYTEVGGWSVVVRGTARMLERASEIEHAEQLPLKPWVPTMKRNFVRISPTSLSGREFIFGEEPNRDGLQDY